MRARLLASSAAVLLIGGGAQLGSAAPGDEQPPLGGTPPPASSTIKPCGTYVTGKAAVVQTNAKAKATICGSPNADKITATGGSAYIETFGGVDVVNAKNGKPDEIWNGSGLDAGSFDSCDRVYDLDKGTKATAACPGVTSRTTKRRGARVRYPVRLPAVQCQDDGSRGRRFRFSALPVVRAFDATAHVDWQNVAWSALLVERVGGSWVLRAQTEWLWDRTYDEQVKSFPGNTWRTFLKNARREFTEIRRDEPGVYRVALHFKWYGGNGAPDHELRVWVGKLFAAARSRSRC